MKNAPSFLGGCLVGTLVTFILYFSTVYIAQNRSSLQLVRDLEEETTTNDDSDLELATAESPSTGHGLFVGMRTWVESTLLDIGVGTGAFTSTVHISAREFVLPIVISSRAEMASTLSIVNSTWGHQTEGWVVALGTKGAAKPVRHQKHLLVAQKCQDFPMMDSISAEQVFCLLAAISELYVDKYQWFIVVQRSTYVAVNQLTKTLLQLDSSEMFYIGQPASYSVTEMTRMGLVSHESICRGDAGIVLSRAALRKITPHLRNCWGYGLSKGLRGPRQGVGDVELGRCFSRRLGITCSHSLKMDLSTLFVSHPKHPWTLQDFVTFYPINSYEKMLSIYFYDLSREITTIANLENSYSKRAHSICELLPNSDLRSGVKSCNFSFTHSQITAPYLHIVNMHPVHLDDLTRWEIFTDNKIYNSEKFRPVRNSPRSMKMEVEFVLNKTLAALKGLSGEEGLPLVSIQDVYSRYRGLNGREYILDLVFNGNNDRVIEKRMSILLPHLENMFQVESTDFSAEKTVVEFVVPLSGVNSRLNEFLQMYEDVCLKRQNERCGLTLVVYGVKDSEVIADSLDRLRLRYPGAKLVEIVVNGTFSRGRALELGMAQFSPSSLVFICDVDMVVEHTFLQRCRRNALRGKRVYFPEFFKYYNMDYVYRFSKKPRGRGITRQHGHWAMYSYGMLCIYKSDYDFVGGFSRSIEGWGGEDIDFATKVLQKRLDIMRGPDPGLSHRYHDKVCSKHLTPKQFKDCISSRNEDLADRVKLAEYVFYLEEKYTTKKWKLWS